MRYFLLFLLLLTACSAQQPEVVRVGWIGPLTGGGAVYGEAELHAAEMAVEDINEDGGVNGKTLELVVEDGECKGIAATTAARKLIEIDGVSYILGGHCSTESMTIVPITTESEVFTLAGATGSTDFSGLGKYAFRTTPNAKDIFGKLAERAFEDGTRKVVIFAAQTDWAQSGVKNFQTRFEELGGEIIHTEAYEIESTDYRTEITKLQSYDADAIAMMAQLPRNAAVILQQMNEQNYDIQIYGGPVVVSKATNELSGGALPETAIGATPHVNPDKSPATREFVDEFLERFGDPGLDLFYPMEGYDAVFITKGLIEACGNDVVCARSEILSKSWEGVGGTYNFDENGDVKNPFVSIFSIVNGEWVEL